MTQNQINITSKTDHPNRIQKTKLPKYGKRKDSIPGKEYDLWGKRQMIFGTNIVFNK